MVECHSVRDAWLPLRHTSIIYARRGGKFCREMMRMAETERTLIIVKPDGVQRGLVGEILGRLERRGLKLVALQFRQVERALAEEHYAEHQGQAVLRGPG